MLILIRISHSKFKKKKKESHSIAKNKLDIKEVKSKIENLKI